MNKTDRMLAIVLELQRTSVLRAEDLAAIFETSVRTIYRDIQALSEAGVPVVGEPGVGYSLMEGYFLPPVTFTAEEAVTLIIGTDFIEQRFDQDYGQKARSSRGKIEAILPEPVRMEATRVRKTMRLLTTNDERYRGPEKAYVEKIRQAILHVRKVKFGYAKRLPEEDGNRHSVRVAAPYGLVFTNGSWVLVARCELRQDIRHFRLSRMNELTMLDEAFQLPSDFNLQDYAPPDDRNVIVRVQVHADIADKVKESPNYYRESIEELEDGCLHMTFRVRLPEELLQWVLGWGAGVVVVEPESLRRKVREEILHMLEDY
ncbi:helix-turn-helix transcriptional regulator [Paenibacillus guangzhouensis]|uniref:helix-turn-helix transcriptional regulator n=1 Tax=Paenibacillus guangzhouensis TaxID=1473112 RepID=UPI0012671021|nr:YafY family protein [Paenibacillus guangzhouensis]